MTGFQGHRIALQVLGVPLELAAIHRQGSGVPLVCLHGFGSTKEDYADIVLHPAFEGRAFLAFDAPGCGESQCSDLAQVSIPFLVATAQALLERLDAMSLEELLRSSPPDEMAGKCTALR